MPKLTGAVIQQSIENLDIDSPTDVLSEAFKNAKTQQEFHKKTSEEFKILEKFKNATMKTIRSRRKGKSIEEQDQEIIEIQEELAKRQPKKGK